jgi:hypothetical protein
MMTRRQNHDGSSMNNKDQQSENGRQVPPFYTSTETKALFEVQKLGSKTHEKELNQVG